MSESLNVQKIFNSLSEFEKKLLYDKLKIDREVHPIEHEIGLSGEAVLAAIQKIKAEAPLTWRMLRGVLAEMTFGVNILEKVEGWKDVTPPGDLPFDYLIDNGFDKIRIQIKLQRSKSLRVMMANEANRSFPNDMYVVETQKTRGGKDSLGNDTRPYRFGEFDILAVSMQPSTGKWNDYMYTLGRWLIANPADSQLILKFQPVAKYPNNDWTNSLEKAIEWYLLADPFPKVISH